MPNVYYADDYDLAGNSLKNDFKAFFRAHIPPQPNGITKNAINEVNEIVVQGNWGFGDVSELLEELNK